MSIFNLRIGGRLFGGFGALVLFGAVLAGYGVTQLWGVQSEIADLRVQSGNALRIGDIVGELQATRRAILRYAFDQDEPSFAEAEKRLSKTTELLKQAASTTTSQERRKLYEETAKRVAELEAKRVALGQAVTQMLAGRKLLFTDGDRMAADVQKFVDAAENTDFARDASALFALSLIHI